MKAKTPKAKKARKAPVAAPASRGGSGGGAAPTGMPRRWAWHYRTLLTLRERLLRATQRKRREVADAIEPHGMHAADSATDEFDHDLLLGLLDRETGALTEIDDALARLLQGRYGVCEETGDPIPLARLRAIPWCRYGVEAEARLERQGTVTKFRLPGPATVGTAKPHLPAPDLDPAAADDDEETEAAAGVEVSTEMVEPAASDEDVEAETDAPSPKKPRRPGAP